MKVLKIALALAIAAISSFTAHAKNDPTTAYMFGFASSFSDSTVYMTSVQRVDSVYLTHKKLFLDNRENYSLQLKEYLESIGAPKRTCIVIFDRNFKKAEKKWTKLHDRYTKQAKAKRLKNGEKPKDLPTPWQMKNIDESKFMFKAVEPSDMEEPKTKAERGSSCRRPKVCLLKESKSIGKTVVHHEHLGNDEEYNCFAAFCRRCLLFSGSVPLRMAYQSQGVREIHLR